jgi:hypothetical protein
MRPGKHEALLPGEELVARRLADLAQQRLTGCSLPVRLAASRLKRLGIPVPAAAFRRSCEHQRHARLADRLGAAAHSHRNSLLRRIVSHARALEREQSRTAPPV